MHAREAVVLSMLTACGINPAYDEASATGASDQSASTSTTTGAPSLTTTGPASTSGGTTGDLEATADAASTSTGSSSSSSSTGDATTTDASTTGTPAGDCPADDPSLIACYAFEEDPRKGLMVDGSQHGFDGSRAGTGAVASVEGFGAAVELSPGSDVHVIDHPEFVPAKLTLAAFIYIDQVQINKGLIDREGSYGLFLTEGKIMCRIKTGQGMGQAQLGVEVDRWYHFTCTFDGERVLLYGHGLDFDLPPVEALLAGEISGGPSEFVIGRDSGNDETKLHGAMDQVLLFDRVLDPGQICELAGPLC